MRRIPSLLTVVATAAGLALSSAPPAAAAGPFCFGLPDEPLAYACVTVHEPAVPDPELVWGEPVEVANVPAVCYGLGCTEEGPVSVPLPWVSGIGVPTLVEVYYGGVGSIDPQRITGLIKSIPKEPCPLLLFLLGDDELQCTAD